MAEDFETLPIEDKLTHKLWKARLSAYTTLIDTFAKTTDEQDHAFQPYFSNPAGVREWVRDSNAVSQEKGVEAACSLVQWGGKGAARSRPEVVPSLVEKCLGSARAGTKAKAIELCLLYVEVEGDQGEGVVTDLLPGLDLKQPKVVAGTVQALAEIIRSYGPRTVKPNQILASLPKIFAHSDGSVRAQGTALALALHGYLGPALDPSLRELKPVQVKELGETFKAADEKGEGFGGSGGKQTRWTRAQQRERLVKQAEVQLEGKQDASAGSEDNSAGGADADDEPALDPYELATPFPILSSLPEDFYTNLSSSKWKDRSELALAPLLTLLSTPRLASGNYNELVQSLAGRMTDANVMCVTLAAQCLEKVAVGLRTEFKGYREMVTSPLLGRTKEKKQSVLDGIGKALDAVFDSCNSLTDFLPDISTFVADKNPSIKQSTLSFITRSLSRTTVPPSKSDISTLIPLLITGLGDSTEPVRAGAAEAMGTLVKCVGERALGGAVDGLDDSRKQKVKEAEEKAVVKVRPGMSVTGGGGAAKPPPAAVRPKPKPAPPAPAANKENAPLPSSSSSSSPAPGFGTDSPSAPPVAPTPTRPRPGGPPARLLAKKPPTAAAPPTSAPPPVKKPVVTASSAKPPPASKSVPSEPLKFKFSQEDAEARAEELLPPTVVTEIGDGNWKIRLAAVEALTSWCEGEGRGTEMELIVRFLSKKPGWKESNFQVAGKMFAIFQLLAESAPTFSKAAASIAIPPLSDKLGDMKLKGPAGDALCVFAEKSSLGFVLGQAYEPMTKQKAPKAQADSLVWVDRVIREFGIAGLPVRDLIEFLKNGLKSTNAAVRTSATKTLVTLKLYVGADITTFLQDLNPALLTTIESEFAKVAGESPPPATKTSADLASPTGGASGGGGGGGKGKGKGDDALDELFPRVDLEKLVSSGTTNGCGDSNWKVRKESLEEIQSTLEANKRLKAGNLPDLTTQLKLRMADSNKIVQGLALDVIARIATGMGKPFERQARILAGPVAGVLADQKATVRAAAVVTLSAMADAAGLDSMIGSLDKPLNTPNPLLRKDLLGWLEQRFAEEAVVATLDLTSLAEPVLSCLEDRNAEVRKSATAILPAVVSRAGYSYVADLVSKLKPASRSTVSPLVEAARASAATLPTGPSALTPSSSAPAPSAPPPVAKPSASARPVVGPARPTAKVLRPASVQPPLDETITRASVARPRPSMGALRAKASTPVSRSSPTIPNTQPPPFRSSEADPKRVRATKDTGGLKWVVDGLPRPDQVEALYQQMAPQTSGDLLAQLFSKDHNSERDYIAALSLLDDCAKDADSQSAQFDLAPEELKARLIANVDLIFKYITLRIGMTSTSITIKCLDLIDHVVVVLDSEGHKLTDYEVSALLLSLIAKVGDGKETIRQRVRAIFRSVCNVYPFSKVFTTLLDNGLVSKNARTRTECANELGLLFERYGISSFPMVRAMPLIAKLISDRDASVRNAALGAIAIAGADASHKYIGTLPDKERTMLDERLKHAKKSDIGSPRSHTPVERFATPDDPVTRSPPSPSSNSRATSSSGFGIGNGGIPAPKSKIGGASRIGGGRPMSVVYGGAAGALAGTEQAAASPRKPSITGLPTRAGGIPRISSIPSAIPSTSAPPPPQPSQLVPPRPSSIGGPLRRPRDQAPVVSDNLLATPVELQRIIHDLVANSDLGRSAELLKQVQAEIAGQPSQLIPEADSLMNAITNQMNIAFTGLNADSPSSVLRLAKHLMQTLTAFFDQKALAEAVSTHELTSLLGDLTGRLLDTAENPSSEAISSISKVLNMLLIRIFHNADQTGILTALLSILQDATVDLRDLREPELTERAKYAELVMKCLWKVSKTIKESLEANRITAPRLLSNINSFLTLIPPGEWRRRNQDQIVLGDMPLRTIKTILQQVVAVYAEQVFDHLEEIPDAETSFIYQYLFRVVSNTGASGASEGAPALSRQASVASTLTMKSPTLEEHTPVASPKLSNGNLRNGINGQTSPATPGNAEIEMNNRLKEIFDLIGDPTHSRTGIAELYEYQKQHPEAEGRISHWMAGTGNYFQTYLKRALDNLAQADREKGLPLPAHIRSGLPSSPRPGSSSGTPIRDRERPMSVYSNGGGVPGSPRAGGSRSSSGPLGGTPAKLSELQELFGFAGAGKEEQ
ncbi:ARM repeat-containing protein [Meredithblackwellia eburnea MCA 4105]